MSVAADESADAPVPVSEGLTESPDPTPAGRAEPDAADLVRHLGSAFIASFGVAWAGLWVIGSYIKLDVFHVISMVGLEPPGGIPAPPWQLGTHTFGDYYQPLYMVVTADPWSGPVPGTPIPYPPAAMAVFSLFGLLPYRVGLFGFLGLLYACLVLPLLLAMRGSRPSEKAVVLGLATVSMPVTMTLDRGNQIGLIVPFLALFAVGLLRDRWWWIVIGLSMAVALKVYPVLLCIALLRPRRWTALVAAGLISATMSVFIWSLYPGGFRRDLDAWTLGVTRISGGGGHPVASNYSLRGSLMGLAGPDSQITVWLGYHQWAIGFLYLAVVAWILLVSGGRTLIGMTLLLASLQLAPPTSFRYTSIFAIVVVALLLRAWKSGGQFPLEMPRGPWARLRGWLWVAAMILTVVPWPFEFAGSRPAQLLVFPVWAPLVAVECVVVTREALLALRARRRRSHTSVLSADVEGSLI